MEVIEAQGLTPPPRAARMMEGYRDARRAWAVVAAVAGVLLLTWLLMANARWQRLAHHGVIVSGRVAGRRQTTGKGASNYLTVDFPFGRETRTGEFEVDIGDFDRYGDGDPIPVKVDPEDGTNVRPFRFDPDEADGMLHLRLVGWLVGGGLVALAFWADANAVEGQRKRLQGWNLGEMTVDRVLPTERKTPGLHLEGHYTDAEGRTRPVARLHLPTDLRLRETLPILYDPVTGDAVALASLDKVEMVPPG